MTNGLHRQVLVPPGPDPDAGRSETNSTAQPPQDASSNRTQSVAAPSTRCMTPDVASVRRGTPSVAGSSSGGSSQPERLPAEVILRDLINDSQAALDAVQVGYSRYKRPREEESDDEPSSKRDKLGEELEKLEMEATQGWASLATRTPETQRQVDHLTPPDSNRAPPARRILTIRQRRGRPQRQGHERTPSTEVPEEGSSGDETYRADPGANQTPQDS
ncbi:hypothetical protein GQ53DRAFT_833133 [Thozetella sp. PMI_491]|nr:hypothetical protein GQ53DRAFT_833133 [Thozetella sp. PMI_491]